jgi:predicted metal-dependent hydrolase
LRPPPVLVREQEKRWGSCNSKGELRFNWRVMMAPMSLVDYVVAHEVCHLVVRDHSTRFWKLLGTILPDFEERRARLRVDGVKFYV